MKTLRLITAQEERKNIGYVFLIIALAAYALNAVLAVMELGSFQEYLAHAGKYVLNAVIGHVFLVIGSIQFVQGILAGRKRKKAMENGTQVNGTVTAITAEGAKSVLRYRVEVSYDLGNGEKRGVSQPYLRRPHEYLAVSEMCPVYVWKSEIYIKDIPRKSNEELETFCYTGEETTNYLDRWVARGGVMRPKNADGIEPRYPLEDWKSLDATNLQEAKKEWNGMIEVDTGRFVRLMRGVLLLGDDEIYGEVYVEIRYQAKKALSRYIVVAMESGLVEILSKLKYQYRKSDYEFLKTKIWTEMEQAAKKEFGKIPVTEVVVELL